MKNKIPFSFLIMAVAMTLPLRLFQYFFNIDATTGFYEGVQPLSITFNIMFYGLILVLGIVSFLTYGEKSYQKRPRMFASGIAVFVYGLLLLIESAPLLFESISFGYLFTVPGLFLLVSVLAGLVLIFESPFVLLGTELPSWFVGFSVIPPIWAFARSLTTFMNKMVLSTISDRVLSVLIVISIMMFVFYFTADLNNLLDEKGHRRFTVIAHLTAYVVISISLARIVAALCGANVFEYDFKSNLNNLFMAVFMIETAQKSISHQDKIIVSNNSVE